MEEQVRQDLELVRTLMVDARGAETEHGPHLVLWGLVMSVGLLATWAALQGMAVPNPAWVWLPMLALGWIGSSVIGVRAGRTRRRVTPGSRMLAAIWIGAGVTLTLIGVSGLFADGFSSRLLPGLTSVVIGATYYATSAVTGRAAERWLAAAWWLGGGAMLIWSDGSWTLPVQAVMVLLFEVAPGLALLREGRRTEPVGRAAALS